MRNAFRTAVVKFILPDEFLLYDCKMNLFFKTGKEKGQPV